MREGELFVRVVSLGGPHTWDFVPGSDARGEIPSTATRRVDEAVTVVAGDHLRVKSAPPDEKNSKRTWARRHHTIPRLRIADHCAAASGHCALQARTRRLPMHTGEPGRAEHRGADRARRRRPPEPVSETGARRWRNFANAGAVGIQVS